MFSRGQPLYMIHKHTSFLNEIGYLSQWCSYRKLISLRSPGPLLGVHLDMHMI